MEWKKADHQKINVFQRICGCYILLTENDITLHIFSENHTKSIKRMLSVQKVIFTPHYVHTHIHTQSSAKFQYTKLNHINHTRL